MMNPVKRSVLLCVALAAFAFGEWNAVAADVPPTDIASGPLFSGRGNVHPNMLLDLSVEFPTVGAAYRGSSGYDKTAEYIGYFNPAKCYTYPGTEKPLSDNITYAGTGNTYYSSFKSGATAIYASVADFDANVIKGYLNGKGTNMGKTTASDITNVIHPSPSTIFMPDLTDNAGYFSVSKDADANHECGGDSFSGNFMNWSSSSAIDMLRYAMTGGDRYIDETARTVLQRAYLPDGTYKGNFYADGTYFPRKSINGSGNASAPNQVTPFTAATLYVVSCRNRILFSNTNGGGNCDSARTNGAGNTLLTSDKYFGEYLARVKVCDSAEGADRNVLCQKYGDNYKPVGELQRHADKIRVGAMGYLVEYGNNNNNLYGGVLRAPIKYLGAKKFVSPSYSESPNDKPEWDATTGVFYNNPEDPANRTSASNSGVVNYLNKFGRTSASRLGEYKGFDPLSELYYEGMRYLQGKQPTPDATSALGELTLDANFPVLKTWSDPISASCQSNYVVTIADVNTHYDRYIPGNTRTNYTDTARTADALVANVTPALDVMTWTKKVGDMEADASGIYGNPSPRTNLAGLETIDTGSGGHGTYYMSGLAYWANTSDIRLDKPVRVKTFAIDVDEGGNGSYEDTNPRGTKPRNSQMYLAAKYGGFNDKNKDGNPFKTFDTDNVTVISSNKEWDSDNDGIPDNYFLASQPSKMIDAIKNIFQAVSMNSGTISGVTLTSTKISTDSQYVYQPGFDPSKWNGSLLKLRINLDGSGNVTIQDAKFPTWDAGIVLSGSPAIGATPAKSPDPAPADRKIYTARINADKSLTTTEFKWDSLTTDQQTALDISPVTGLADGLSSKRVDFLRGVRSDEIGKPNGIFRARDGVLGDIINSNPTYVGAPALNVLGADYQKFYDDHKTRTKAVYVGANDGMLHAFGAADGKELFAYVPNVLIPRLNQLTSPSYIHQPYVDGALTVAEAKMESGWKTVLASGMGGGAQGVFVLDVTNPADFAGGSGAIWEFTDNDDPDIGNVVSAPLVAKFKTSITNGVPVYNYFVVVPSGLNNYKDDGANKFNANAPGALFLLSLDKKSADPWTLGGNYYKFTTPIKDVALQNGLSSPALVVNNDGAVIYAYAGDLQGDLWRFDFTGTAPWSGARPSDTPLFTAQDKDSNRQPITMQPKVVFAPGGGYVVLFGTGKFVEDADAAPGNFKTQSFYGIYDTTYHADRVTGRSQLEKRTLAATKVNGEDAIKITGNEFSYGTTSGAKKGWYFDFLNSATTGERGVTNPLVVYGRLYFNSLITGSDPCSTGGGRSYTVDTLSGLPLGGDTTGFLSQVGLLSSPVPMETAGSTSDRNAVGGRTVNKDIAVVNFGTGGVKGTSAPAQNGKQSVALRAGRFSWREILNWQQ
ncbi:MAG TPA: PilC/PilY family type IV pilus protein, partial [Burkholderiaceae bacterium]|nr:PilC/PilY family type IV pilus protein [Burkholderiaceae bacterium]